MKTLVIIDVQNDFLPGGSLEVPFGDEIIPVINQIQDKFDLVVVTQDWHPANHMSFASNHKDKKPFQKIEWDGMDQVLWPPHCVQNTDGAKLHPNLNTHRAEAIFRKGMHPQIDSYSVFYDNGHKKNTGLAGYLRQRQAGELYFCGLAADVCVWLSVKDALSEGFDVTLVENATKPIDPKKFHEIKQEMKNLGVRFLSSENIDG